MNMLNEDVMKTNLDIPEGEIKILGTVNPVYADAIDVHEKKKEEIEKELKEHNKIASELVKETKMDLEESLFEPAQEDKLNEYITYDEPKNMGKGHCAPTVPDYTKDIMNALEAIDDDSYTNVAKQVLASSRDALYDAKETVEQFNNYWSERYAEAIEYIDKQLELIPMNKLQEDVGLLDAPVNKSKRFKDKEFSTDYIYKSKRAPLAEIIQDELTSGETVYRVNKDGGLNPTFAPSLNIDYLNVGAYSDDKGDYIIANVADATTAEKVKAIGKKYDREVTFGFDKYVKDTPHWVKIYLKDSDWTQPFVDPNVVTVKTFKS